MSIDYVVPMVFHRDESWRENFRKVGREYDEDDLGDFVRYRSWDTEELLIQLVRKNMPWLRRIYILLAQKSQVQEWMRVAMASQQTGPEVRVVFHREFMPEWALPTFNSRAMEMFLHRVPGISEYFLYGNDDMFPIRALAVADFFRPAKNGGGLLPCIHMTEKVFPEVPNNFQAAAMCGLNFVAKRFGKKYRTTWLKNGHSIAPIVKKTCELLWMQGGQEIAASVSAFRLPHNFNQYIYSWWQYFAGEYVDEVPARRYVNAKKGLDEVEAVMRDGTAKIVCVNDNEMAWDWEQYGRRVREVLKTYVTDKQTGP